MIEGSVAIETNRETPSASSLADRLVSHDPATGEFLGTVPIVSPQEVREVVAGARRAQASWGALPVRERAAALAALKRVLVSRAVEIAELDVSEQGKTQVEAYGAIIPLIHLLGYLIRTAPRVLRTRRAFPLLGLARAHRTVCQPYGVVGVISPWNYPLTLSMEPILTALIAGNSVVLKPSEHTPLMGLKIAEMARDAGLADGLLNVVTGDATTGAALIDAGIDKLVFTGSVATGRKVAARAAEHVLPTILELGGKDAAIVLEDADLARAAAGITWGATFNAGQACLAIERVYVVDSVADRFLEKLTDEMGRLRVGPGARPDIEIAAITTAQQLETIEAQIEDAVARGARVLCGGKRLEGAGRFFAPTVLADVSPAMRLMQEETFGPVIAVQRVPDADEAIERTNRSAFGLTCSIWTRDQVRGRDLALRVRAGDVALNEHGAPAWHAEIPWGGVKQSGYGKVRGKQGLLEMVTTQHISWSRALTRREIFWFPYSAATVKTLRRALYFLYGSWRERWAALLGREIGTRRDRPPRDEGTHR